MRNGSFNRAAQELNYAQSTVTMQIQKLESELGVTLLERGKELTLTEAGRLFYEQSLSIVQRMEQLQNHLHDLKEGVAGHVRIGATEPTASFRLPGILKAFMAEYPNIRISIEIANTPVLTERMLAGEIDFSLTTTPDRGANLYFEPLFQEEFVAFMPEQHPLAQQQTVAPEDLQGYRVLITSAICPYRKKLEMVLRDKGNVTLDTMEVGSMTALKSYVESGLGIALIPRIMAGSSLNGMKAREVSGDLIHMTSGLACRESSYPLQLASRKLYQYIKQQLSEESYLLT
ncbi:HTH-type transcriptional regulator YtlI [Paenibacillus sp. CCS19]|nr:HTH-type transcriptional regulator YtlI [Paenibacillus cellulosilyticus]